MACQLQTHQILVQKTLCAWEKSCVYYIIKRLRPDRCQGVSPTSMGLASGASHFSGDAQGTVLVARPDASLERPPVATGRRDSSRVRFFHFLSLLERSFPSVWLLRPFILFKLTTLEVMGLLGSGFDPCHRVIISERMFSRSFQRPRISLV
jgi:hypothetical protein